MTGHLPPPTEHLLPPKIAIAYIWPLVEPWLYKTIKRDKTAKTKSTTVECFSVLSYVAACENHCDKNGQLV